jgi:regulation of enolase protein 1 (concanavalin A-like superfamily)
MKIRFRPSCLALAIVLAIGAGAGADDPPLADDPLLTKSIKGWGKVIDPKGDCQVEEKDGTVTMTVAGRHDLSVELNRPMDAPRVMREVEGDFITMVKVAGAFAPTGPSTIPNRRPYLGAGLLVWQDVKNYVRLERASVDVDGQVFEYLSFEQRKNGETAVAYSQMRLKSDPLRIRLERRNGKLYGAASYDGLQWASYLPLQIDLPAKVQVGVAAISSSATPFIPDFSELEIYKRVTPAPEQPAEK